LNKSITIISLNYYPEDTAIGLYSTQMAEYLQLHNWDVTVLTGFPYYPQWKIEDSYSGKEKYLEEIINNVRVLRYKQFVPIKPTFIKRIIHIIDFTIGTKSNIRKIKKSNIVLSIIPFTSSAWLGMKLSKKLNAKHWIHIQDFEFDIALESGISSNRIINKYFKKKLSRIESNILNSADIISSISNGMLDKLKKKSSVESFFFPNWIDPENIDPKNAKQHLKLKNSKFTILYSGNIGGKQDWDLFIKVADFFNDNKNIEFIIVGNGSYKKELIKKTQNLGNVRFINTVPLIELNDLLCSANLHFLFQKEKVLDSVMPSKILNMMASEVPCLITGNRNSEIAKIILSEKIGFFYESNETELIIQTIEQLEADDSKAKNDSKKAREFIINSFSKKKVLNVFNKKLNQLNES